MSPWAVKFTGNLPTQAFTRSVDHIIIIPKIKRFCNVGIQIQTSVCQGNDSKSFKTTFRENGRRLKRLSRALDPTVRTFKPKEKPTSVAILPYIQTTYSRIKRMFGRYSIKNVSLPPRNICIFFGPVKDDLRLRTAGAYSNPCECGQVYLGRLVDPLRPDLRSITGTLGLDGQTR
jgi:hypothetical protein